MFGSPLTYPELKSYRPRLPRQLNGRFKDKDIAEVLQQATKHPACAFGYRQVPLCAQDPELQKIKEARDSNVRSLNEYRKCLGLKRTSCASRLSVLLNFFPNIAHKTFLDWNSDVEVATHAEQLYKDINNLELYVSYRFYWCRIN
jgi:linoleate 10R-lipoxygenase